MKLALQLTSSRVEGAGLIEAGAGSLNVAAVRYLALVGDDRREQAVSIGGETTAKSGIAFYTRYRPSA